MAVEFRRRIEPDPRQLPVGCANFTARAKTASGAFPKQARQRDLKARRGAAVCALSGAKLDDRAIVKQNEFQIVHKHGFCCDHGESRFIKILPAEAP
jgi:hypothetical protein